MKHSGAVIALLLIATAWGATFTLVKDLLRVVTPEFFLAIRFLIGGLLLLLIGAAQKRLTRPALAPGLVLGVLLGAGYWLQTRGLMEISPSRSALLTGVGIIAVPMLERVFFRGTVSWTAYASVAIAVAGIFFLVGGTEAAVYLGDFLTLAGAIAFALHIVMTARYSREHGELALAGYQVTFVGLAASPSIFLAAPSSISFSTIAWIFAIALVTTAGAFLLLMWAQQKATATEAAVILSFEPVAAAATSLLFYGERWELHHWIGATLVVGAMVLSQIRGSSGA